MVKRVGESFDPGIGFVRRRDMQQWFATTAAHTRPALARVQELTPYVEVDDETAALLDYAAIAHAQSGGLFDITSGVLRRALAAGHRPRSFFLAEKWLGDLQDVLDAYPQVPAFIGSAVMAVGASLLCARARRPCASILAFVSSAKSSRVW